MLRYYYESVTSLHRESTYSLIHKPARLVVQDVASLLRNRVTNKDILVATVSASPFHTMMLSWTLLGAASRHICVTGIY